MSVKINLKHSSTKDKAPVAADLSSAGEVCLNIHPDSPALYIKDSGGDIIKLAGANSASTDTDAVKKSDTNPQNIVGDLTFGTGAPNAEKITFDAGDGTGVFTEKITIKRATGSTLWLENGTGTSSSNASTINFGNVEGAGAISYNDASNNSMRFTVKSQEILRLKYEDDGDLGLQMSVGQPIADAMFCVNASGHFAYESPLGSYTPHIKLERIDTSGTITGKITADDLVIEASASFAEGDALLNADGSVILPNKVQIDRGLNSEAQGCFITEMDGTRTSLLTGDGTHYLGMSGNDISTANMTLNADGTGVFSDKITVTNDNGNDAQLWLKNTASSGTGSYARLNFGATEGDGSIYYVDKLNKMMLFRVNDDEIMRLQDQDGGQRVGIGVTTMRSLLDVGGDITADGYGSFGSSVALNAAGVKADGQNILTGRNSNSDLTFYVRGSGAADFGAGNITLNVDGTASTFTGSIVVGDVSASSLTTSGINVSKAGCINVSSNNIDDINTQGTGSNSFVAFAPNGVDANVKKPVFRVANSGSTYIGNQTGSNVKDTEIVLSANGDATFSGTVTASVVPPSDARFKENIEPAKPQLADVVALGGILKNYDWNDQAPLNEELRSQRQLGLIAQEAAEVCPTIVKDIHRTKQGAVITPEEIIPAVTKEVVDDEGVPTAVVVTPEQVIPATYEELDDSYKGISTDALIMKLIGAVAELSAEVTALKAAKLTKK